MAFEMRQKVLFRHCDPAGIVFFPRYFEMVNDCVEQFFEEILEWPFEVLHTTGAVPTAHLETTFMAPSTHGDWLLFKMGIDHLGQSSMRYHMTGHCDGEERLRVNATLVVVDEQGKARPWPDELLPRVANLIEDSI